ncbi:MAG: thiol peroxidase [Deltaproteobacteria bacterium]|nr:thiol peroxidase [Deltaproteobacteria bacterium]MBW1953848.1 thiol peroxidase [Deltaproteobacteria bacterium]MBW2135429.1 thiol peroxidase [Deltaproteobacteria bacterium]
MPERPGLITFQNIPLTLIGNEVRVGELAPDVEVLNNDLIPVRLSDWRGQVCLMTSVPSLDTPVCDLETQRFNDEAAQLGPDAAILTISMDLPFAQKRWCGAAGVTRVQTLSDHRQAAFGQAYGVLIKELRLLARAVWLIGKDGIVRYFQLVKEITDEPDYDAVLRHLKPMLAT